MKPDILCHYVKREGSITRTESIRNLLDIWSCYYELYHVFRDKGPAYRDARTLLCFQSVCSVWRSLWKAPASERSRKLDRIEGIISFARLHSRETAQLERDQRISVLADATGKRWTQFFVRLLRSLHQGKDR